MQNLVIIGNLVRDPEMRYTKGGQAVTQFAIAVNYKSGDKEEVDFFRCVAWAKLAEVVAEYCRKGNKVCVTGEIHRREWEAQDGSKRETWEVTARNVEFLSAPRRDEPPIDERQAPRQQRSQGRPQQQQLPQDDPFDGLPF